MQKIKELMLQKRKMVKKRSARSFFRHEWQVLADEMTVFFKVNCYWLFWKYPRQTLFEAYRVCQRENIKSFRYLLGVIKNITIKNKDHA